MARIETLEELRSLYDAPSGRAMVKQLDRLGPHMTDFINLSPFVVISTQGADGRADVSPRGEAPGFVQAPDDKTLLIPDRPGNNRLDTLSNILANPSVGLIFLVPGVKELLRVNGSAELHDDADLKARFVVNGRAPKLVIRVAVGEAYLHCAKAILRARLWDPDARVERSVLPSMNRMLRDQTGIATSEESQDEMERRILADLF